MNRKLIRVYVMGYEPPDWDMEKVAASGGVDRIMDKTDVCFTVGDGEGWPVGVTIVPNKDFAPGAAGPDLLKLGCPYRCVRHEYDGKIAVVEDVTGEH